MEVSAGITDSPRSGTCAVLWMWTWTGSGLLLSTLTKCCLSDAEASLSSHIPRDREPATLVTPTLVT